MKKNLLFIPLLIFHCSFGQLTGKAVALVDSNKNGHLVRFHCAASVGTCNPLIVVDEIEINGETLARINPNEIISITILKHVEAQAIYGSRGINGVIFIETKRSKPVQFVVKDFIDGHPIPLATVALISKENENVGAAKTNDTGFVSFKNSGWDEIIVSAIGYESDTIKNAAALGNSEILLRRDYKNCNEVVVVSQGPIRCIRCSSCGFRIIKSTTVDALEDTKGSDLKVYPNPVGSGQPVNIEFQNQQTENVVIRMMAADGKILFHKEVIVDKGLQHVTIPTGNKWTAASYFIQVMSKSGTPIFQKQIVIQ